MHVLYLDDSGSVPNLGEDYFVLGGTSIFEAQAHHITAELDRLAESIYPAKPHAVEFHASQIYRRNDPPWKDMSREEAIGTIKAVLRILSESYESAKVFACVIHKDSYTGQDPVALAFEDLCSRFDIYLSGMRAEGDRQRGLLVMDASTHETSLQHMARNFRALGTRWGSIHNLADVPFFVNSKASRLVQLADHVAYSIFRYYETDDLQYFNIIADKFHEVDGILHGLSHKQTTNPNCMCPACLSRRAVRGTRDSN